MHLTEETKDRMLFLLCAIVARAASQQCTCARFFLVVGVSSAAFFPVGVIELIKQSGVDHLLLPWDGHSACAELLKELIVIGVKLDALDLGELCDIARVLGIDHVGLWHPGGWDQAGLQTGEVDGLEPLVLPGILQVVPNEEANAKPRPLEWQITLQGFKNKQV